MNRFVHRMLGHYLMDELEEGNDLGGGEDAVEVEADGEGESEEGEPESEEGEEEEVVLSIAGEEEPAEAQEERAAPQWVKDLRKSNRELQKKVREYETREQTASKPNVPQLGPKPTLEGCDYDGEKFEQDLTAWHERKRQIDAAQKDHEESQQKAQQAWQAKLDGYATAKADLKFADFEDAEQTIEGALDLNKQAIIIAGADNPALVVYALGKNPKLLKELQTIEDPTKFAFAVAKLETKLKVEKRKPASQPEKVVSGTAPKSGAMDNHLEKLRAEAEKSGDFTKVMAYKKQQKEKQRAKG